MSLSQPRKTHPEEVTDSAEVFLLLTPLEECGLSASSSDSFDLSPIISGEIPSAATGPGGDPTRCSSGAKKGIGDGLDSRREERKETKIFH